MNRIFFNVGVINKNFNIKKYEKWIYIVWDLILVWFENINKRLMFYI